MTPWLETLGALLVAALGAAVGLLFSRLRKPYWLVGYFLPLVVVLLVGLGRLFDSLSFVAPFCWLLTGRARFALLGAVCAALLTTPLSRLPRRRQKVMVALFIPLFVVYFSVLPFLVPALIRGRLSRLQTVVVGGVCLQTTDYTCGPAASVTALRMLGLEAEEGELAILAHTTPTAGTAPDLLCAALEERYGAHGLRSAYRRFQKIDEIPRHPRVTLAVVKLSFLVDHYVAVLEVADEKVIVGDPARGKRSLSHAEFKEIWRFSGIVLWREG